MSISELRALCNAMLQTASCQESALLKLQEALSSLISTAESFEAKAQELRDMLSQAAFSDPDLSILRTLLSRASENSDVSTHLASEIAALNRVLDLAEAANENLERIQSCAEENCALSASLVDPLYELDGKISASLSDLAEIKSSLQSILALLEEMEAGGASSSDGLMDAFCAMIRQMDAGIQAFDSGIGELQTNFALFSAGISSVDAA